MRYLVTKIDDSEKSMEIEYGSDGFLKSWKVNGSFGADFWRIMWAKPPYVEKILKSWPELGLVAIKEMPLDLTFVNFWELYRYKVGNRKQAEKLWNLLSEADKMEAMAAIPKYLYWLACRPNMEQTHATTWLNQRRWENDYSKKK